MLKHVPSHYMNAIPIGVSDSSIQNFSKEHGFDMCDIIYKGTVLYTQ